MNRMLRPLLAGGFVAMATALSASGCADNNSTLFIDGVLYQKPPECTVTNEPSNTFLGSGIMDVAFTTRYRAWMLVGNQFASRGAKSNSRTETTRVSLTGAEIDLSDSQGTSIQKFSVFGSGFADVSRGEDPGWGLFAADLIPDSVGQTLAANIGKSRTAKVQVVANVKVFGMSLGNTDVTSSVLSFPIDVCYGCLVQYPIAAMDPDTGICTGGSLVQQDQGCNPGQDDYQDCRDCVAGFTVCRRPDAL